MQLNIAKQRWTLQDTQNVPAAAAAAAAGAGRGGAEKVKEAAGAAWRTERGSDERARMDVTAATAGAGHDSRTARALIRSDSLRRSWLASKKTCPRRVRTFTESR